MTPTNDFSFNSCEDCQEPVLPSCGPGQLKIDDPCPDKCLRSEADLSPLIDSEDFDDPERFWGISLEDAISIALTNSDVMRDLGGTVLRSPTSTPTVYDPAIAYTDPIFGEEAALSAFDATLAASALFENNDRAFNNLSIGTAGLLQQDLHRYQAELRKRAATGTELALRHVNDYDANNQSGNRFGLPSSSWETFIDAEVRQPLLQGAGVAFNRIAGPTSTAGGVIGINGVNGVLLSRMRADISLADFEAGTRDLISNVENAYWDLYFAYYDLDAKRKARDAALRTWERVKAKAPGDDESSLVGESAVFQAQEQYWRFQAAVLNALDGRIADNTRTNSGSSGGTFRSANGGVRLAERRLRLVMGLPINGPRLIRPSSNPPEAPVTFDWDSASSEALALRVELREQRWRVKQRELELVANKNFLLPRLDLTGRYRFRGFGKDLISQSDATFSSAVGNLGDGDFQEWQLGVEFEVPLGFRQAHAAVRNSKLSLSREVAILKEQERTILFGLSNAVADVKRAYNVMQAEYNRRESADKQLEKLESEKTEGFGGEDRVLEAQRRWIESNIRYYQSQVEYALALRNVHFEKGTLLEYNNILLTEGASPRAARAQRLQRKKDQIGPIDYSMTDVIVSPGKQRRPEIIGTPPTVSPENAEEMPIPADSDETTGFGPEPADGALLELSDPSSGSGLFHRATPDPAA